MSAPRLRPHAADVRRTTDYDRQNGVIASGWEVFCWCGVLAEWVPLHESAATLAAEHVREANAGVPTTVLLRKAAVPHGCTVTAVLPINGVRAAWQARLVGALRSGRLMLDVTHRGVTRRVITDPSNVRIPAQFYR